MPSSKLLIKLASDSSVQPSLHLRAELKKALSPATNALLRVVSIEAEKQRAPLYIVGGFVRDLLLDRPNLDIDLVLEGDAVRFGRVLVKRLGGRLTVHQTFGTAVWWLVDDQAAILRSLRVAKNKTRATQQLPEFIDLISARRETYARPGALPHVQFADIAADQNRRDFTINTLALRLDGPYAGQLLDPWGGLNDMRRGILSTLHSRSFLDDPTRVLRVLRLAGRLKFKIESSTLRQLKASLNAIAAVSGERIRKEMELVLEEDQPAEILGSMQRLGVLRSIHPNLRFDQKATRLLTLGSRPVPKYWQLEKNSRHLFRFVLWLINLSPNAVAGIAERLRFSVDLHTAAVSAARLRTKAGSLKNMKPSKLVSALKREPLLSVYALFLLNKTNQLGRRLQQYVKDWRHVKSNFDGNALRKMGLKPGPVYGQILDHLRAAWLDGKLRDKKQEGALLEKLVDEHRRNS
ncbi:MAG: hypothetical protein WEC37_03455 [Anaerolineales bacterium]